MHINLHVLDYFSMRIAPFRVRFRDTDYYEVAALLPLLGFPNVELALAEHVFGDHMTLGTDGKQWLVTEAGIYSLLLVSPSLEAQAFKQWAAGAVLPAIRKDGGYFVGEASSWLEEGMKPLTAIHTRSLLDDILPSLQADRVYVKGQEKLKKGRITKADFRQLVKDVVKAKWEVDS